MLRVILILCIFNISYVFSNQKSNFDIISEFNTQYSQKLLKLIIFKNIKELELVSKNEDVSNLLRNQLIKSLNDSNIIVTQSSNIQLNYFNSNSGVFYTNHSESQDSIVRTVSYKFSGFILSEKILTPLPDANYSYTDTIYRYDIEMLENKSVDFAHNSIPAPEQTFWESFIEPVAIIATAALTVFLLFTLRTQ